MTVTINGTTGITTPDLESEGPVVGTTGTFSGNLTLGSSTLATPTGSAPSYTCRAWVNFNGTGTVAIRASGNVSSITDNGVGQYTVNFTTAMPDANYSALATAFIANGRGTGLQARASQTTTAVGVGFYDFVANAYNADTDNMNVSIFR